MALLQSPSLRELAACGIVLSVHIALGIYRPRDKYVLCVDLAEYFKLKTPL